MIAGYIELGEGYRSVDCQVWSAREVLYCAADTMLLWYFFWSFSSSG